MGWSRRPLLVERATRLVWRAFCPSSHTLTWWIGCSESVSTVTMRTIYGGEFGNSLTANVSQWGTPGQLHSSKPPSTVVGRADEGMGRSRAGALVRVLSAGAFGSGIGTRLGRPSRSLFEPVRESRQQEAGRTSGSGFKLLTANELEERFVALKGARIRIQRFKMTRTDDADGRRVDSRVTQLGCLA